MKILSQGFYKNFTFKAALATFFLSGVLAKPVELIADDVVKPFVNDQITKNYKITHLKHIQKQCKTNENKNYMFDCDSIEEKGLVNYINDQRIIITFNGERKNLEDKLSDFDLFFDGFNGAVNQVMRDNNWFETLSSSNYEIIQQNGDKYNWINIQIETAESFVNHDINVGLHDSINIILQHEIAHGLDEQYLYQMDNGDNYIVKKQKKESFSDLYAIVNTLKDNRNINPSELIDHFIIKRKKGLDKDHTGHFSVPALVSLKHILQNNNQFINNFNNSETDLLFLANLTNHSVNISTNYGKETNQQEKFLYSYLENGLNDFHVNVINSVFNEYQKNKSYDIKNAKKKRLKVG